MIPMPLRTLMPLAGLVALVLGALLHILTGVTVPEGDVMAQAVVFHANIFIGVYAALTAVAFVGALLGNRLKMLSHPIFLASLAPLAVDGVVPAAGGVLIAGPEGRPIGAVGVTGDTSDNDESCALAGIAAASLRAID